MCAVKRRKQRREEGALVGSKRGENGEEKKARWAMEDGLLAMSGGEG